MDEILGIKGKKKNNLLNPEIPLMTLNNDAVEETVHVECLKLIRVQLVQNTFQFIMTELGNC